jgi:hypothetical protein
LAGLSEALRDLPLMYEEEYNSLYLAKGFYSPGYIVSLTAFVNSKKILQRNFDVHPENSGYLDAMGFNTAIWNVASENQSRCNVGKNYSLITPLHAPEDVDEATTSINSCIRQLSGNNSSKGLSDLFHVVGELHDNVWSHGLSSGFSMAQRTKVPRSEPIDYHFEFALADQGYGFLREMKRSGFDINSHKEAIEWCIREGNSTKHSDEVDEWTQTLPNDLIGRSPYGSNVKTRTDENHHQGLGLAHLIKLVKKYKGQLYLASGDTCLHINSQGKERFLNLQNSWQGVAISCRFRESELSKEYTEVLDSSLLEIMEKLKGDSNDY